MTTFCTVITKNYMPYAIALYKSLSRQIPDIKLNVLVADAETSEECGYPAISPISINKLLDYGLTQALYKKYAHTDMDNFRWSLKPVFLNYLLDAGFDKVLYTDCDIFFYDDYRFLLDELNTASVILTPHWRNRNPLVDEPSFFSLFTDGFFNAGFIGVNQNSRDALKWWAEVCHYRMEASIQLGVWVDQRYLDVLPIWYDNVKIIRHRGCNVSAWNLIECKRELVNNKVLINGTYPIIFIHFNRQQFEEILKGHDKLLRPYLDEYKKTFEEDGASLSSFYKDFNFYYVPSALLKLKWRTRIRTRIKRFLFRLAEKL